MNDKPTLDVSVSEAAEYLNVARPYLIKLLDNETIPCKVVNSRVRRILFTDLLAYSAIRQGVKLKCQNEMTEFMKEHGFYDD